MSTSISRILLAIWREPISRASMKWSKLASMRERSRLPSSMPSEIAMVSKRFLSWRSKMPAIRWPTGCSRRSGET